MFLNFSKYKFYNLVDVYNQMEFQAEKTNLLFLRFYLKIYLFICCFIILDLNIQLKANKF